MVYDPKKVIEIAFAEVGYLEKKDKNNLDSKTANAGNKNYTKYARDLDAINFYNGRKQGIAWCDMFVDWCHVQANGKAVALALTCQPTKASSNCGAGCKYSRQYYKNKGQLYDTPQPGDQIFFWPSNRSDPTAVAHTGLVYAVDNTYVYTVEGNTSGANGVIANGGGVCKKKYKLTSSRIAGYGRPKWDMTTSVSKKPEQASPGLGFEAGTKIVTITGNSVNIRVGDSTKYASAGHAKKGDTFEYVATSPSGWVAIRAKDRICWVSNKYTKLGAA